MVFGLKRRKTRPIEVEPADKLCSDVLGIGRAPAVAHEQYLVTVLQSIGNHGRHAAEFRLL